jgi:long-chain acyl-CoA synthetase
MTITKQASESPSRAAIIMAESGVSTSYLSLEEESRALAAAMVDWGFVVGDRIAVFMDNEPAFLTVLWAGLRAGLRIVPINRYLKPSEVEYIVRDSDSRALFASSEMADVAASVASSLGNNIEHCVSTGAHIDGFVVLDDLLASYAQSLVEDRTVGAVMTYTSGTTGRPKGVYSGLPERSYRDGLGETVDWIGPMLGFHAGDRFFIAAPLYHTAPLSMAVSVLATGGTLVLMRKFDPATALQSIQEYSVSHGYLVPTMMLRMLKLPAEQRARFNPSGTIAFMHTGEPCPPAVKRAMIEWWGPKFLDMYGASELPQGTLIDSTDWLRKPGSVGRPFGCEIHILDDAGRELGPGEPGMIYLDAPESGTMRYHKAPEKTAATRNEQGWVTVGDIGYLDEDGFLFLTDRKSNVVISGGVNIYPRECEDALLLHPEVTDAVCLGLPDSEMGERLVAVVEPRSGVAASDALAESLVDYCRERIANYKCPRQVFFWSELPRMPTGKIARRDVRQALISELYGDGERPEQAS